MSSATPMSAPLNTDARHADIVALNFEHGFRIGGREQAGARLKRLARDRGPGRERDQDGDLRGLRGSRAGAAER